MKLIHKETLCSTVPFELEKLSFARETDNTPIINPYYRLASKDWVNILPVTSKGEAVLVRQFRVGSMKATLETPGGVMDEDEKDPTLAVIRELEEETGYSTQRVLSLGSINPNPALMTNRIHFFLGLSSSPVIERKHFPDAEERVETVLVPTTELNSMIRTGSIDHALCGLCIFLSAKYVNIG